MGAVQILFAKEINTNDDGNTIKAKQEEYKNMFMQPGIAAEKGYITEIIEPRNSRQKIAHCFNFLSTKKQNAAVIKKHGNIPL